MHLATERRAPDANRVPLDLWVRLRHEDYAEPFDADGVDLSRGGLSLRADFLPEVGDRMRCRFDSPAEGEEIDLGGEVVWAHDAGERGGQFGLRFTDIDDALGDSLSQIVRRVAPEAFEGPDAAEGPAARVKLHLDGVASPVEADLVEHDDEWICAEQALPFLRLGMGVVVEGSGGPPRGRLAAVSLRVEDGMPRLVLQVDLEEEEAAAEGPDTLDEVVEEATDASPELSTGAAIAGVGVDATLQDYEPPVEIVGDPGRDAQAVRVFATASEDEREEASVTDHTEAPREAAGAEASTEDEEEELGAPAPSRLSQLAESRVGVSARAGLTRARAWTASSFSTLKEKAGPTARAWFAKLAALFALAASKAGPKGKAAWAKVQATASTAGGIVARKVLKRGKRRTTARPPRRVAGSPRLRQQRKEALPEAPRPKVGRRVLALCLLAFAAVGMGVYALSGDESAPESEVEALPAAEAPPPAPAAAAPAAAPEAPNPEEGPVVIPAGGRLEAPSFPSLQEAGQPEAPVREGTSFGAASVEGRASTIRMSQPVSTLRGQEQEGGFTITIPGSLALDRAGPIAAAHPAIERATILNRGDHAVLTVRFVAGRTPAYRVVAQGSAIQLTVAR